MNTVQGPLASASRRFFSIAACTAGTLLTSSSAWAVVWDGGAGTSLWETPANWANDVLPAANATAATGEALIGSGATVNLSSTQTINMIRVGTGGATGTLNILTGTNLTAINISQVSRVGAGNGGTGIVNHSGGSANYNTLQVGLDAGSTGAYNLAGGSLSIARESGGNSLFIGENGNGSFTVSGGALTTRAGVRLGTTTTGVGRFTVEGSAATSIAIGTTLDGQWTQNAGSTLEFLFDDTPAGITKIFINETDSDTDPETGPVGGNVTFANNSLLDVGFLSTSIGGTWTVMEWEGTLTNNGLKFAPGVDTNIWSFAFVGKTLQVTAMTAIPEPSTFAALAGLGVLGLAVSRRRRSA